MSNTFYISIDFKLTTFSAIRIFSQSPVVTQKVSAKTKVCSPGCEMSDTFVQLPPKQRATTDGRTDKCYGRSPVMRSRLEATKRRMTHRVEIEIDTRKAQMTAGRKTNEEKMGRSCNIWTESKQVC